MNKLLRSVAVAALILSLGMHSCGMADDAPDAGVPLPTAPVEEIVEEIAQEAVEEMEEAKEIEAPEEAETKEETKETEAPAVIEQPEATPVPEPVAAEDVPEEASEAEEEAFCVLDADWNDSDIQTIFAKDVVATITDVRTGISWQEVRKGGTNHADVQPCTAKDTAKLKKVYGGDWSWKRRAIWVTIDGKTYAASMNGMPHGQGSVSGNRFDGHHCIHFTNSRTHTSEKIDANHQKMIQRALSAAPSNG